MSQFPYSGGKPNTGMSFPPPSPVEIRIDPADGNSYSFEEVRNKLQARGVDPVTYWYERMAVSQPTDAIKTGAIIGDYGTNEKGSANTASGLAGLFTPRNLFLCVGVVLLLLLCIVPVWNCLSLIKDANYVFWAGRSVPTWIMLICLLMIFLYVGTTSIFFSAADPSVQTEQTIMMIANIFITLFGLILMLAALPLIKQSTMTYTNLMHSCDYSEQTHRLFEYSQVLQNIRGTPDCKDKFSVEECIGYEPAPPYTDFLKGMESNFRCAGFCYRPMTSSSNSTAKASLLSLKEGKFSRQHFPEEQSPGLLSLLMEDAGVTAHYAKSERRALSAVGAPKSYPPTLFSDANYQATCEGMAARDMKNFAGDIGQQTFYQGIYLVLIAVTTGFLKLVGFCVRKG